MKNRRTIHFLAALALVAGFAPVVTAQSSGKFHVEEASITDIQNAIRAGKVSCKQVVQMYLDRTKAYNGACTALLTADGKPIPPATGMVRAGAPLKYPTQTANVGSVFPGYNEEYKGTPYDLGHMETAVSDPSVQLQMGLRVGIFDAGQLDAFETINIRGERSITCKGDFDRNPKDGPLPAGAPKECEEFRKMPDALERAAELDAQYGKNPDLKKLPMYCNVLSLKDWYDAKDMRATGGNDVKFAMDAPKVDSPGIAILREKGAIIFAVANAEGVGGPGGHAPVTGAKTTTPLGNLQYSVWGGQTCNPYDTARVSRGTSNGSGTAVSANLSTCSVCEQTSASCKGPASRMGVVNFLPTKGVFMDGGFSKESGDRAGIHCKTVKDAAMVLDAGKGYETEDIFTAIPIGLIPDKPYTSYLVSDAEVKSKPLKGVKVAIVRDFMVKHTKNDVTISDMEDKEIKAVLGEKLGATLVEALDPMYPDDPAVPNVTYTFADAFSEVLPHTIPEIFFTKKADGSLAYAVPGWDVTSIEYLNALEDRKAPLSPEISLRSISETRFKNPGGSLSRMQTYLAERGDSRVKDWASWIDNAKFKDEEGLLRAKDALKDADPRAKGEAINYLMMQSVMRMVVLKVMYENKIDVFVNPEQTTPPYLLGGALEPDVNHRPSRSCCQTFTAMLGSPEVEVPAGFTTVTFDPKYVLSKDKKSYYAVTGNTESKLPHPMPISMMFWSGPGNDGSVLKVASAYEAATHHRTPPPMFGPLTAAK